MRFRIIKQVLINLLLFAIVLTGAIQSQWALALAQPAEAPPSQEYFVRQQGGEALLIRISAFEAEIESRVYDPQKSLLSVSALPGNRIAPLFQFIDATHSQRQLDIQVSSKRSTGNSKFEIEFTRLRDWDERSGLLVRAYHLLAYAMQARLGPGSTDWSINVSSLLGASKIFAQYGMREQRLWSTYLAAYLVYYRLGDYPFAARLNDTVLEETNAPHWQEIRLAALQLKADILIKLSDSNVMQDSGKRTDPVQAALFAAAQFAQSTGFGFEQASAVYTSGLVYAGQGLFAQASAQYQNALKLAQPLADDLFLKEIRESVVAVNARQGNAPASGQVLQQIETQLLREGGGDELALNLLQQGDLLLGTHRWAEAIEVLTQALEQQNDSSIRSRANLALATASYEDGDPDAALAYLDAAGVSDDLRPARNGKRDLDVAAGLEIKAAIYRARGEYEHMQSVRQVQHDWLPTGVDQARYFYQRGLDALARGGGKRVQAVAFFRKSYQAKGYAQPPGLRLLAQMQLCVLGAEKAGLCTPGNASRAYQKLVSNRIPRQVVEARFLRARYLTRHGQRKAAMAIMEQAVDDIHFYRQMMPGMLGAWYWQHRNDLFTAYLDLASTTTTSAGSNGERDFESLLALSRIRFAARPVSSERLSSTDLAAGDSLRQRFAMLANSTAGEETAELITGLQRDVDSLQTAFNHTFAFLSRSGLKKALDGLARSEAVLTYHLTRDEALAWLGKNGQVRRFVIAHPDRLFTKLQRAHDDLPATSGPAFDVMMQEIGEQLLKPLAGSLPETIYFVPEGLLTGFPVDALRLGQEYLIEHHRLVNVLAFPSDPRPIASLHTTAPQRVFIAGSPQDYSAWVESRLATSPEIQAVAEQFIGPGLHIVQGRALLRDEFDDTRLQRAELVHLSMPAVMDFDQRQRSGLMLSEPRRDAGREMLSLTDISANRLQARLVFLSASRIQGEIDATFAGQPALVTDYLATGAHAIIAGSWRPASQLATELVTGFYRSLAVSNDITGAMTQSKRDYLRKYNNDGSRSWAAYQLYIR